MMHPVRAWLLVSLPAWFTLLLMLLSALPQRILPLAIMPMFAVMSVYYWGLFRPVALPLWAVFLLSVVQDVIFALPLGVSPLLLLSLRLFTTSQRRVLGKETFLAIWFGFIVLSALVVAAQWLLAGFVSQRLTPVDLALLQWVAMAVLYPPVHHVFNRLYALIPSLGGR